MKNAYAYIGTKDITKCSSSGGAFMAIAKVFFETYKNGKAFGVAFGDNLNVEYAIAENFEECKRFQGSKYVKSDMNGVLEQVVECLKSNIAVLFTGTPCAVAAIKKAAQTNGVYVENLWLVDLICHGTVDKKLWKDYLAWIEKRHHAKVESYSFRYKPIAWRGYPVYVKLSNGHELIDTYEARTYIRAFLKSISMRRTCFQCPFKTTERTGDVTLGDLWGAETVLSDDRVSSGVSLCLENTETGSKILQKLQTSAVEEGAFFEKLDDASFMKRQDNLKHALTMPNNYETFWTAYEKYGFDTAVRKAGIYTTRGLIRAKGISLLKKIGFYSILKK